MTKFTTKRVGRVYVHFLPHTRFRTKDLTIRLHIPLKRENVTQMALLPYMWMNGTTSKPTTREIMMAADDLYGTVVRSSLGKRGEYHIMEVGANIPDVSSLTAEPVVEQALALVCEILLNHGPNTAAFSEESVRQEVDLHRRRIEAARDDKMGYALQSCLAEVAEGTASALPRLGYAEDLASLNSKVLYDAYQSLFQSAEVHAYLVGPYADADALSERIIERLSPVLAGDGAAKMRVNPLPTGQRQSFRNVTEHQDVAQAQLDLGYRTGVNFSSESYPAMLMMNGVLGGFAHSKLFLNVREKHSLAYSVWSHFDAMTGSLAVMTGIEPKQYQKALDIIEEQVQAIKRGAITDDEMDFTFRGLQNQYTVLLDQPASLTSWHYNGVLCGEHRDIEQLLQQLSRVTKEEVVSAASQLEPSTIYFLTGEGDAK
ncbi:insulinase family protein [Alicyclobacillus fastidiosus]|uniref:Insulinase family protein n=1 Tax=Alicyclobacillus fastidiosus TaxID=392011 RepID=A0ABY6ZE00_9BACL|nr:pitrilysin family protein [Alicyclobacillus fastidiosus]WAH40788.1 insulinase family protein [Alicyclobacillus fastidiosus]